MTQKVWHKKYGRQLLTCWSSAPEEYSKLIALYSFLTAFKSSDPPEPDALFVDEDEVAMDWVWKISLNLGRFGH